MVLGWGYRLDREEVDEEEEEEERAVESCTLGRGMEECPAALWLPSGGTLVH